MEPRPHAEDVKPDEHLHLVHDHEAHETGKEEAWACMLSQKPPETLEGVLDLEVLLFNLARCIVFIASIFPACSLIRPWIEALVPFAGKPVTSGSHKGLRVEKTTSGIV